VPCYRIHAYTHMHTQNVRVSSKAPAVVRSSQVKFIDVPARHTLSDVYTHACRNGEPYRPGRAIGGKNRHVVKITWLRRL
jgi:hypothetical protein